MQSKKIDRLRIARHALLTAVALDIIGIGFVGASHTVRQLWFPISKKQAERIGLPWTPEREAPRPKYPFVTKADYGKGSFNTEFTLFLLEFLSGQYPHQLVHVSDTAHALNRVLAEQEFTVFGPNKLSLQARNPHADTGLPISTGIAVGLYSRQMNLGIDVLRDLTRGVAGAIGLGSTQARTTLAISYLTWSLLETGYFGCQDMEDLIQLGLTSEALASVFDDIVENHDSTTYFERFDPCSLPEEMPYSERILAECCWYLARIATQYKDDGIAFTTVPKENLGEVLGTADGHVDLAFLFGTLCILSEQTGEDGCYKLVIPEVLATESKYAARATSILKSIA